MTTAPTPGTCRFCGCTEDRACRLPTGEPCSWFDRMRTICNNPACICQYFQAESRAAVEAFKSRPKKRTPADIHLLMLAEKRARRRAARARRKGKVA